MVMAMLVKTYTLFVNQSERTSSNPFANILLDFMTVHGASSGLVPPVTCIVSDISMSFTIQAAEELSLPVVLFNPSNACTFLTFIHFSTLLDKGLIPLNDESYLTNGYLDTKVDCIPGLQNIRLKDLPDFIRITDTNDSMLEFIIEAAGRAHRATAFIFNTSNELEKDVMNVRSLLDEPSSVVYVNFGSMTVMTAEKLLEFAWGLTNSKQHFQWIIRSDLVICGSVVLSSEFKNEISDRSLIASWCPQEQVLNHPSIGGFLTHCGWNSTTESIYAGVPMLCWPFFADQPAKCRYICNEWEIGMEIDTNVKRDEVEKLVNELMVGEKGKKMRKKIIELQMKVDEDPRPGGCSYMNLEKVIMEVLLKQNQT
ncbi:putative 7-deoxyloganetin glucosyltransferase [Medicago truncatula]|uniref:Putative 7-deoxyloganetin glucosyltransferase n=1 Tax=Medicago truncatula TaxID=3880 RepID=A0A396GP58_MEDTR|nr:putative 7-deoxyloganetin glucosyltransferase [Medicago truncatula]